MNKLNITKNSRFWLYVLSKNYCTDITKNCDINVGFFENKDIDKEDVIMLYCKDGSRNGFLGILQLLEKPKLSNGTIKIFKDNNFNRFYSKLKYKKMFGDLIKPNEILNSLQTEVAGFKSVASFRSKFLKNLNTIIKIELYGKKIIDKLIEVSNSNDEISKQGNDSEEIIYSEEESKSDNVSDEEEESKCDSASNDEKEESENDDTNGLIPIMIEPCKNFEWSNDRVKYFVEHYKNCKKCKVTNNNDRELCSIIDEAKIEVVEIDEEEHGYFNPVLENYYALKKCEPLGATEYPFVRVSYINNDHDIYNKCLLVSWCCL